MLPSCPGLVEFSAILSGFGQPAAVTAMEVLVLDRELADSPVIVLFSCYPDQRAGRQPSTKIGAPGGVASALCALVHNLVQWPCCLTRLPFSSHKAVAQSPAHVACSRADTRRADHTDWHAIQHHGCHLPGRDSRSGVCRVCFAPVDLPTALRVRGRQAFRTGSRVPATENACADGHSVPSASNATFLDFQVALDAARIVCASH